MKKVGFILLLIAALALVGCSNPELRRADASEYTKTMDYHDDFTILQLTDIHWNGATQIGDEAYGSEEYILKVIDEAKAHAGKIDLIEITGDTFMVANKSAVTSFIDLMTKVGIPYAMTWGNHDRENTYHPNWISEQFLNAPYSLYTEVDNDDVHERSNYVINLLDSNKNPVWQLIQIDSGASYRENALDLSISYDHMRQDQFDWIERMRNFVGTQIPAICYFHVAQKDNVLAYEAIKNGATGYKSGYFALESFCNAPEAQTCEELFLKNNIKAAFIGHDHANDWTVTTPNGVTFGYGVKTDAELYYGVIEKGTKAENYTAEEEFVLSGASLVTLKSLEGDFTLEHLYLNERDEGDFIKWVEY